MIQSLLVKVFGSRNERLVGQLRGAVVGRVGNLEAKYSAMSNTELAGQTQVLKDRLAQGEALDAIEADAFAVAREGANRALGMRHFDVQLIGGAVLHRGKIAEMRTGEGKTLVATLAVYLNALAGKGVHVVTVNDYLARRDAEWMGRLYNFLGLSVGVVYSGQEMDEKRAAYAADITYGTNNEYGFDFLRDNMAFSPGEKVQRGHHYAIVDEVDSILIDEARTPLIISGPAEDDPELWRTINRFVPQMHRSETEDGEGDFWADEKGKSVNISDTGYEKAEGFMRSAGLLAEGESLYHPSKIVLVHHLSALLRAHHLYRKNVEYIVQGEDIVIIDDFTGRKMIGRRWSDGLHQAVEAKEGVKINHENQTLASITFQNYFRLYGKLAGMTGTADTEAFEFQNIYKLEVVVIPTNRGVARDDGGDLVFLNETDKFNAIIDEIRVAHERAQPVLVGTASIDTSERLSGLLGEAGIRHEVLNAKQHEREAEIIAQAGRPGAVTIATNMAGRGTDIVLGGSLEHEFHNIAEEDAPARDSARAAWKERHEAVKVAGGLYVIGSERHESRRIDNQLRGRSGRQGDPGLTRFYLSLDDSLMRIFAPPRMKSMLQGLGMREGEAIEHRWVTRAIETAQRKVEGHNFDIRKNLLEYDNVANEQRKAVYELRDELMSAENVSPIIDDIRPDVVAALVDTYIPPQTVYSLWKVPQLEAALRDELNTEAPVQAWLDADKKLDDKALRARLNDKLAADYQAKKDLVGASVLENYEKSLMLSSLDGLWREHLAAMDYLRQGIYLRGYAQKDPKQEYKREAFEMFNTMLGNFKYRVVSTLARIQVQTEEQIEARAEALDDLRRHLAPEEGALEFHHDDLPVGDGTGLPGVEGGIGMVAPVGGGRPVNMNVNVASSLAPALAGAGVAIGFTPEGARIGRNDPCWCGSGKKYKNCHGAIG